MEVAKATSRMRRRRFLVVTTHYPEVKEYAAKTEDIVNARMAFDKETQLGFPNLKNSQ